MVALEVLARVKVNTSFVTDILRLKLKPETRKLRIEKMAIEVSTGCLEEKAFVKAYL